MMFEPTITLGTVLHALTMVGVMIAAYVKLSNRLTMMETKLDVMWRWWKHQVEANGPNERGGDAGS